MNLIDEKIFNNVEEYLKQHKGNTRFEKMKKVANNEFNRNNKIIAYKMISWYNIFYKLANELPNRKNIYSIKLLINKIISNINKQNENKQVRY